MFSPLLDLIRGGTTAEDTGTSSNKCKDGQSSRSGGGGDNDDSGCGLEYSSDCSSDSFHRVIPPENGDKEDSRGCPDRRRRRNAEENDDDDDDDDDDASSDSDKEDADGGVPPPPPLRQGVVSHGAVDMMVKQRNRQAALDKWNNSAGNIGLPSKQWHAGTTSASEETRGRNETRGGRATHSVSPCCRRGTNEIAAFNWEIYSRGMRAAKRKTIAIITEDSDQDDEEDQDDLKQQQQQQRRPLISKKQEQARSRLRKEMEREKKEKARAERRKDRIQKLNQQEEENSEESEADPFADAFPSQNHDVRCSHGSSSNGKAKKKLMRSTTGPARISVEQRARERARDTPRANKSKLHRSTTDVPNMRQKKEETERTRGSKNGDRKLHRSTTDIPSMSQKEETKRTRDRDGNKKLHRSTTDIPSMRQKKEGSERTRGSRNGNKKLQRCTTDPGRPHHNSDQDRKLPSSSKSPTTRGGRGSSRQRNQGKEDTASLYSSAFAKLVDAAAQNP